jgi:hypothetical protein
MALERVHDKLNEAWLLRWNQKVPEAKAFLEEIQEQSGWRDLNGQTLAERNEHEFDGYADCLLLKASLFRAQGEFQKSGALIARIHKTHLETQRSIPFRLHFELGLDHWLNEYPQEALDCFVSAEKSARTEEEKINSLSNLLWCLESLDIDRTTVEEKIEKLLLKLSRGKPSDRIKSFVQQYQAYELRKGFYSRGEWPENSVFPLTIEGQGAFFAKWAQAFPYFKSGNEPEVEFPESEDRYLWQKSYRLRTLKGFSLITDKESVRVPDAIDRLYLWVWRWLACDPEINIKKIQFTLESIVLQLDLERLSKENLLLLRNALSWLSLLQPKLVCHVRKTLNQLRSMSSPGYWILNEEFQFIEWLKGKITQTEKVSFNRKSPFASIAKELSAAEESVSIPRVQEFLKSVSQSRVRAGECTQLVLNMAQGQVQNLQTGEVQNSPLLLKLFSLAVKKSRFPVDDIDPSFGQDKRQVYNLLSRARKIFPGVKISIDGNEITAEVVQRSVCVVHENSESVTQGSSADQVLGAGKILAALVSESAARLIFAEGFKRQEIEKSFKISKASTCRVIAAWIADSKVQKNGNGKEVKYTWLN